MEGRYLSLLCWISTLIFTFCSFFTAFHALSLRPSDAHCSKRWSVWSPVNRGMQQTWRMFPDLTLLSTSEFFKSQFHDVDADTAWDNFLPSKQPLNTGTSYDSFWLSNTEYPIAIPTSRLHELKLDSDVTYVHPPRVESSVLAIPEVFVQLECLNLLRQHLGRYADEVDYSHRAAFKGREEIVMHRADLCIERLRNMVMCWSDLGTILQPLVEKPGKEPQSLLDFATRHKCRDFSSIREWTEENAVKAVRMDDAWWGGRVFEW